jgi:hypothetical protein
MHLVVFYTDMVLSSSVVLFARRLVLVRKRSDSIEMADRCFMLPQVKVFRRVRKT